MLQCDVTVRCNIAILTYMKNCYLKATMFLKMHLQIFFTKQRVQNLVVI